MRLTPRQSIDASISNITELATHFELSGCMMDLSIHHSKTIQQQQLGVRAKLKTKENTIS